MPLRPGGGTASAIFAEVFEEHHLTDNVTYTCDDTFSLVSAGLSVGFVPEWTEDLQTAASN